MFAVVLFAAAMRELAVHQNARTVVYPDLSEQYSMKLLGTTICFSQVVLQVY